MNIRGIDRALILQALYNATGLVAPVAILTGQTKPNMTLERATWIIEKASAPTLEAAVRADLYFDYLDGRLLKVNLAADELDLRFYDRDNGPGAGERAIRAALPVQNRGRQRFLSLLQAYIDKPRPSAWSRLRKSTL